VLSLESPSELLYAVVDDLQHPITAAIAGLAPGWHDLPARGGLDFVRGNLVPRTQLRPLAPDVAGPDNDLGDLLDLYVQRAIGRSDALMYAFGERWGPETARDKIFGFKPGFLAFQSQAWHTDDSTGHAIEGAPPGPAPTDDPSVRILAAMVNPNGGSPERETVLLLNASPQAIDLNGWRLADRNQQACAVPAVKLNPGAALTVVLRENVQLGNKGGSITLLDKAGLKVSGVAYTADQAKREGWTVTF